MRLTSFSEFAVAVEVCQSTRKPRLPDCLDEFVCFVLFQGQDPMSFANPKAGPHSTIHALIGGVSEFFLSAAFSFEGLITDVCCDRISLPQ